MKNRTTIPSKHPLSGYLSNKNKNKTLTGKDMFPYVPHNVTYNSPDMKELKCPWIDKWIKYGV